MAQTVGIDSQCQSRGTSCLNPSQLKTITQNAVKMTAADKAAKYGVKKKRTLPTSRAKRRSGSQTLNNK